MLKIFDADERSSWTYNSIPALEPEVNDLYLFLIWSSVNTELGELDVLCAWAWSEDGQEKHRILKEDLRRPRDPCMTALILGALISLERLKDYKYSGICQSAAETFPDFEFLFHKSPSTSQAALESMIYNFRTVAWALLDRREAEKIDHLLSTSLSHTEHMAEHTEALAVYWKIRLGKSWGHRYALVWTKLEAISQVKASRAMLERLMARTRARECHHVIRILFLALICYILLATGFEEAR